MRTLKQLRPISRRRLPRSVKKWRTQEALETGPAGSGVTGHFCARPLAN